MTYIYIYRQVMAWGGGGGGGGGGGRGPQLLHQHESIHRNAYRAYLPKLSFSTKSKCFLVLPRTCMAF